MLHNSRTAKAYWTGGLPEKSSEHAVNSVFGFDFNQHSNDEGDEEEDAADQCYQLRSC